MLVGVENKVAEAMVEAAADPEVERKVVAEVEVGLAAVEDMGVNTNF